MVLPCPDCGARLTSVTVEIAVQDSSTVEGYLVVKVAARHTAQPCGHPLGMEHLGLLGWHIAQQVALRGRRN
jgi:hypothetical protein